MADIDVRGVHPVESAGVPCHLLDVEFRDLDEPFDLGELNQPDPALPEADWQAPYDEVLLDGEGRRATDRVPPMLGPGTVRIAFFLHDLDLTRPLRSPLGDIRLPPSTSLPARLETVHYEPPDGG